MLTITSVVKKSAKPQIGPVVGARPPYMELSYFKEEDREYFLGRERFIQELVEAIEEKSIIALVGASGSGKSSVVYASVIPTLRDRNYIICKFRPGSSPMKVIFKAVLGVSERSLDLSYLPEDLDLVSFVGKILEENPNKKFFLFGDQFEEIFTLSDNDLERKELGRAVLQCAKEYTDRFRFFITIRADFITRLLERR